MIWKGHKLSGCDKQQLKNKKVNKQLCLLLSDHLYMFISQLQLYSEASIALLHLNTAQDFTDLTQQAKKNLTLEGKELTVSPAYLFWDLSAISQVHILQQFHAWVETKPMCAW